MNKLFIENLVFSGFHGQTGREQTAPQRFQLNIEIDLDTARAAAFDSLDKTYDYKRAKRVAESVVSGTRSTLIETVAHRIACHIVSNPFVYSAEVTVRKIDSGPNGVPGTIITERRNPQMTISGLKDFDISFVTKTLERERAISFPALLDYFRDMLLFEARSYTYVEQPEYVGKARVREQLSSTHDFPDVSLFRELAENFESTLQSKIVTLGRSIFDTPLHFDELALQKYPKGSIGITPHMDQLSRINLGCIFILGGISQFALCDNRSGDNPRYLDTTPGNVILLRAPGFMHSSFRPFHFVTDIAEERIVFSLRQKRPL